MKDIKIIDGTNPSIDERRKQTEIANDVAKLDGYENGAQDLLTNTVEQLNSKNPASRAQAQKRAADFTSKLLLLCLYQKIEDDVNLSYMEKFSYFEDEVLANGNSKEYIANILTGYDSYNPNLFVPAGITNPEVESHTISMFNSDGTLGANSYQFKKPMTIREANWMPYFMSGKLGEFISGLHTQINKVYDLFKFNLIATLITQLTPNKLINGVGKNMFESFATEIYPLIGEVGFLSSDFNYSVKSELLQTAQPSDLLMIVSNKIRKSLAAGISSQLFNAKLFDLESAIPAENILSFGNKINIGNSSAKITVDPTKPYIDDNTIIIINKNSIKHLLQINKSESQAWSENMTIQLNLHIWGVADILPWAQVIKYINPNLSKLPE